MLVRLLQLYYGPEFGYCDYYSGKPWVPEIAKCCGKIPCRHGARIHLTKNHDFKLDVPQIKGARYLIQYRDFIPSVVSNFELFIRQGNPDDVATFRKFASAEFGRYKAFVDKWVTSPFVQDQLVLDYGTFLEDPQGELRRTLEFMDLSTDIDADKINAAIAEVDGQKIERTEVKTMRKSGVHGGRDVHQFRHYSPGLFGEIERLNLARQPVIDLFRTYLGRTPAEQNMLKLQGFESLDALEAFIKASEEYRSRQSS
ncbi:MAG: hypothetical protein AAGK57_06155 [Pseudomonadota bacterium]